MSLPTQFAPAERAPSYLLQQQADYFRNQQTHAQTIEAIPDPLLILNKYRQTVDANQALIDFSGHANKSEVIGLRPGEVLGCSNSTLEDGGCGTTQFCRTCGAVRAILTCQSKNRKDCQECCIIQSRTHTNLDLRVWATPFTNEKGDQYTLFVVSDISHEKRRHALEHTFFHDVLNSVGVVQGYTQLLEINPSSSAEYARNIVNGTQSLIEHIHSQQDLLQAEASTLEINSTVFTPHQMLQELSELYQGHPVAAGKQIFLQPFDKALAIESDITLMKRVIGNMIKNALEATDEGEGIRVGCNRAKGGIEIWVHNPAVIPVEIQHHIFERSCSSKGKGRGLGTYSMRLLSENYLNGSIDFSSKAGEGTMFTAHFPMVLPVTPASHQQHS